MVFFLECVNFPSTFFGGHSKSFKERMCENLEQLCVTLSPCKKHNCLQISAKLISILIALLFKIIRSGWALLQNSIFFCIFFIYIYFSLSTPSYSSMHVIIIPIIIYLQPPICKLYASSVTLHESNIQCWTAHLQFFLAALANYIPYLGINVTLSIFRKIMKTGSRWNVVINESAMEPCLWHIKLQNFLNQV